MHTLYQWMLTVDKPIFFFFQHLQSPKLHAILAWPTIFGETLVALALVVTSVLVLDRRSGRDHMAAITVGFLSSCWGSIFLKEWFRRPRPFVLWEHVHVIFGKPLNPSFPSGHATIIFTAAFLLNFLYPKKMRWMYGVAVWVSLTRVYVGVHYPTDLLAGALLALCCSALSVHFLGRKSAD